MKQIPQSGEFLRATQRSYSGTVPLWDKPNRGIDKDPASCHRVQITQDMPILFLGAELGDQGVEWFHVLTPFGVGYMRATAFVLMTL